MYVHATAAAPASPLPRPAQLGAIRVRQLPTCLVFEHGRHELAPDVMPALRAVILRGPGVQLAVRAECAALWIACRGGLRLQTPAYVAWQPSGAFAVAEARQPCTVASGDLGDACVLGLFAADSLLAELTATRSNALPLAPMPLFPSLDGRLDEATRHSLCRAGQSGIKAVLDWIDGAAAGWLQARIAEQQPLYEHLRHCSGRNLAQRQVLLARLLRGRFALLHSESPRLAVAARAAHLSTWRFIGLHRAVFGETPLHFLNRQRLEQARELLRDPRLPVSDVLAMVGYRSHSGFARAFRRAFGYAPNSARSNA